MDELALIITSFKKAGISRHTFIQIVKSLWKQN